MLSWSKISFSHRAWDSFFNEFEAPLLTTLDFCFMLDLQWSFKAYLTNIGSNALGKTNQRPLHFERCIWSFNRSWIGQTAASGDAFYRIFTCDQLLSAIWTSSMPCTRFGVCKTHERWRQNASSSGMHSRDHGHGRIVDEMSSMLGIQGSLFLQGYQREGSHNPPQSQWRFRERDKCLYVEVNMVPSPRCNECPIMFARIEGCCTPLDISFQSPFSMGFATLDGCSAIEAFFDDNSLSFTQ